MPQKKITDLQLIASLVGTESFPLDDSIVTYRATLTQLYEWILADGNILNAMLADGILSADADGRAKMADLFLTRAKLAESLSKPDEMYNVALDVSVSGNALTVALKTKAGANASATDPISIGFRSSTLTSGVYENLSVTGALSVTIPSGTTLGSANGIAQRYHVWALNNGGTIELAICGSRYYRDHAIATTTAISGGANGTILYSTTARTSKQIAYLGNFVVSAATAGTWASSPTEVNVGRHIICEDTYQQGAQSNAPNDNSYVAAGMTTNYVQLSPGIWALNGHGLFGNNGSSPQYTNTALVWATAAGSDTSSTPALSGPSILSGSSRPSDNGSGGLGALSYFYQPAAETIMSTTTNLKVYLVPYVKGNLTGNARITIGVTARKFGPL